MRDKHLAGAVPWNEYLEQTSRKKVSENWKKEKSYSLPKAVRLLDEKKDEKTIQKMICEMLKTEGIMFNRIEGGGKIAHTRGGMRLLSSSQKGMADIIACVGGWYVAIEVKRCTGRVKSSQLNFLSSIIKSGGKACLATDSFRLLNWIKKGRIVEEIEWDGVNIPVL